MRKNWKIIWKNKCPLNNDRTSLMNELETRVDLKVVIRSIFKTRKIVKRNTPSTASDWTEIISLRNANQHPGLRTIQHICLFVLIFVQLENFTLIWRHHHYRWRAANYDLCSALMAVEQWGFFGVLFKSWNENYMSIESKFTVKKMKIEKRKSKNILHFKYNINEIQYFCRGLCIKTLSLFPIL